MATSNRTAVENNKIPEDERLDLVVPRNGSLEFVAYLEDEDEDGNVIGPTDFTGYLFDWSVKTSYQAAKVALRGDVVVVGDPVDGAIKCSIDVSKAAALGVDVIDCVHDLRMRFSGGGKPRRLFAGLLELSKGVGEGGLT